MIAFLIPSFDSQKPLNSFVVAADTVEKRTEINFFSSLPEPIENNLEKSNRYEKWSF